MASENVSYMTLFCVDLDIKPQLSTQFCLSLMYVHVSSAGSRYWQSGSFEVSKSDTEEVDTQEPMNGSPRSAIRVTVLTELEGVAYIQVTIRESSNVRGGNGKMWTLFHL